MALRDCEAGERVDAGENESQVRKRSDADRDGQSGKRSRSDSPGSEDPQQPQRSSSKRSSDSRSSSRHGSSRNSSRIHHSRDYHHRSSSDYRHRSNRRRSPSRDRDESDDDGLCKTYRTYRNSRPRVRSRRLSPSRARSGSRSKSKSPRAAPQSTKFDVMPMPLIQTTGTTVTLAMPQVSHIPQLTKPARKIYVGGLPPAVNEAMIAEFFNRTMADIQVDIDNLPAGNTVVHVYINRDKNYAFVEMRSVDEASNAMALDGVNFNGVQVKVRRPVDYKPEHVMYGQPQPSPKLRLDKVGLVSPTERIFVGGLPYDWSVDQLRSILEPYGALRSLDIIKDTENRRSKGYGFAVYHDPGVTDVACAALNEKPLLGKTLRVHRAAVGSNPVPEMATRVVCLLNAVLAEGLQDDSEFEEIMEDMKEECAKYGPLESVQMPRQGGGAGKVFLEFKDLASAVRARCSLHGRVFDQRKVQAMFFSEDKFAARSFEG